MKKNEFEKLVIEASKEASNKVGKELESLNNDVEFSDEHKEKMQNLFLLEQKQMKIIKINRILKYVACILVCLVVTCGITLYTGVADNSEYIDKIRKIFNNGTTYSPHINNKYTIDRLGFSYFPDGFKRENVDGSYSGITVTYKNDNEYFTLEVYETASNILKLNETGEIHTISLYDAYYNEDINSIEWTTKDFDIRISGNISKSEIIKIAENLRVYR